MSIKIGCHVSGAGGIWLAPDNAANLKCETFQMFTRSPQGGPAKPLEQGVVDKFKEGMVKYGFSDFVIHAPYVLNFGSANPRTYHGSVSLIRQELERGSWLGALYVMFHPGSFKDLGEEAGLKQAQEGLLKVLDGYTGDTKLLIEISAGAGSVMGDTFEELAELMDPLKKYPGFGGICYDTQHAFASGYDIRTEKDAKAVFKKFDDVIGLEWLRMSHVNDSKVEFASHKDRHEHIGEGMIGTEGIKNFIKVLETVLAKRKNKTTFPLILETEHDKVQLDLNVLKKLRNKV